MLSLARRHTAVGVVRAAVVAQSQRALATQATVSLTPRTPARPALTRRPPRAHVAFSFSAAIIQAPKTKLLLNGEFVDSKTSQWIPVKNPVSPPARLHKRAAGSIDPLSLRWDYIVNIKGADAD
jgi:hypothetical protein